MSSVLNLQTANGISPFKLRDHLERLFAAPLSASVDTIPLEHKTNTLPSVVMCQGREMIAPSNRTAVGIASNS